MEHSFKILMEFAVFSSETEAKIAFKVFYRQMIGVFYVGLADSLFMQSVSFEFKAYIRVY